MIKIAILGYGVIGRGVFDIISENSKRLSKAAGDGITVKKVVDIRDLSGTPAAAVATKDFAEVLCDDEISVVVECMGGHTIAYEFSKKALEAKKSVVTSNKEVVACYGDELMALATKNGVSYLFEASVGGGIPLIHPMKYCLWANNIKSISGILNGTTNFMLTMMNSNGASFDDALKKAQELGYAEKDATADVDGFDAARKIAILSSIALGSHISLEDVSFVEGIRNISAADVSLASKCGMVIKLLARSVIEDDKAYIYVAPHLIGESHPLANTNDVFNAVCINCDMLGDAMFYGRGAGSLPTASAVVSDVIEASRFGAQAPVWGAKKQGICLDVKSLSADFFVRCAPLGAQGLEKLVEVFGTPRILTDENDEYLAFTVNGITEAKLTENLQKAGCTALSVIRIFG